MALQSSAGVSYVPWNGSYFPEVILRWRHAEYWMIVRIGCAGGHVCGLPFLTALAPSERYASEGQRRHKKVTDWGRQGLLQAARCSAIRPGLGSRDTDRHRFRRQVGAVACRRRAGAARTAWSAPGKEPP